MDLNLLRVEVIRFPDYDKVYFFIDVGQKFPVELERVVINAEEFMKSYFPETKIAKISWS
jgi:hypothetical protein